METLNQKDKITLEGTGWGPGSETTRSPCGDGLYQQEVGLTSLLKDTNLQA